MCQAEWQSREEAYAKMEACVRAQEEARRQKEEATWQEEQANNYGTVHTQCIVHNLMRFSNARHRGGHRIRLECRWFVRYSWNRHRWQSSEPPSVKDVGKQRRRLETALQVARDEVDKLHPRPPSVGSSSCTVFMDSAVHELRRQFPGTWPREHMLGDYYRECYTPRELREL